MSGKNSKKKKGWKSTFWKLVSWFLCPKPNGLFVMDEEIPFPPFFILDAGDPTPPLTKTSSWLLGCGSSRISAWSEEVPSLSEDNLPAPFCRNDFSWMAKVGTWSDRSSSGFSVLSSTWPKSEAGCWPDLVMSTTSLDDNSFLESWTTKILLIIKCGHAHRRQI